MGHSRFLRITEPTARSPFLKCLLSLNYFAFLQCLELDKTLPYLLIMLGLLFVFLISRLPAKILQKNYSYIAKVSV